MLLDLLHAAARGSFPLEDGRTDVIAAAAGAPAAVLSFTAHHVVAADVPAAEVLARLDPGDLKGPMVLGRGLADRLELSVEVAAPERDRGLARRLVAAALAAAAPAEPVFAQVAAANAASLRALQGAGFAAVGAEVLFGLQEDFLRRAHDGSVAPG